MKTPQYLSFNKIGSPNLGYISVAETQKNIPFDIKRVYWTYYTPQDVTRGGHAHLQLEQVIVAVSGSFEVVLDNGKCVGIGTHKELMKKCKVYKEIALSQVSKEELENV